MGDHFEVFGVVRREGELLFNRAGSDERVDEGESPTGVLAQELQCVLLKGAGAPDDWKETLNLLDKLCMLGVFYALKQLAQNEVRDIHTITMRCKKRSRRRRTPSMVNENGSIDQILHRSKFSLELLMLLT